MSTQTKFNRKVQSLIEEIAPQPIGSCGSRIRAYELADGRQIALQIDDGSEINIWVEPINIEHAELVKLRNRYQPGDGRSNQITEKCASHLARQYAADQYKFSVRRLKEGPVEALVVALLNLYKRGEQVVLATDQKLDSDIRTDDEAIGTGELDLGPAYESDSRMRRCIERYAVECAVKHYDKDRGYEVTKLGKPYDLLCTKGHEVIHVEVKGTRGDGKKVIVTKNEISDARNPEWRSDLFILHGISVELKAGELVPVGGIKFFIENWNPRDEHLEAIAFRYSVPIDKT